MCLFFVVEPRPREQRRRQPIVILPSLTRQPGLRRSPRGVLRGAEAEIAGVPDRPGMRCRKARCRGEEFMPYEACLQACLDCAMACERCLQAMMGQESHNECPSCCRECLAICLLCAQAIARDSKYIKEYCRLCAEICDWCAEQCAAHVHDHCQQCAESCRRCAEACRAVAA